MDLEQCPEGLGELDKLETLDLSENRIETLDGTMASLFKLKKLNIRGNRIKVCCHLVLKFAGKVASSAWRCGNTTVTGEVCLV